MTHSSVNSLICTYNVNGIFSLVQIFRDVFGIEENFANQKFMTYQSTHNFIRSWFFPLFCDGSVTKQKWEK